MMLSNDRRRHLEWAQESYKYDEARADADFRAGFLCGMATGAVLAGMALAAGLYVLTAF
jgi:hypothetical protein